MNIKDQLNLMMTEILFIPACEILNILSIFPRLLYLNLSIVENLLDCLNLQQFLIPNTPLNNVQDFLYISPYLVDIILRENNIAYE